MMLAEQVFAQASLLAGELDGHQRDVLRFLCETSTTALQRRLRNGITAEDCRADFVAAASLYALAALNDAGKAGNLEEFRAGDLTIRTGAADAPSRCLQRQADLIIMPFITDSFCFRGV